MNEASAAGKRTTVLIMAAGEGTRMRSSVPKMLHPLCGRPLVAWPIVAAQEAGAGRIAVIVSPQRDISEALPEGVETVVQPEADGTGGALRAALDVIQASDEVVVLSGDHPFVTGAHLSELLEVHRASRASATVMTADRDPPDAFGRIVRGPDNEFDRIEETKHPEGLPEEILAIREVNTNTFAFEARVLADALGRITVNERAGEYYLGDVLPAMRDAGAQVVTHKVDDPSVTVGVNSRAELAVAAAEARHRICERMMLAGVTIVDPRATWIDADVEIGSDATIEPGCVLRLATRIGEGSVIGPHTILIDTTVGDRARVIHSHLTDCDVEAGCTVGPFTYVRPGTVLHEGVKAGAFVEIKNSEVGAGSKVPHLSYIGDADLGEEANVGAGTITANYDGFRKHRTTIGKRVRLGVDTSLVAPVSVGDDAYTGAGSVIAKDVPAGALGITRPQQENVEGYAEQKRKEAEEADD